MKHSKLEIFKAKHVNSIKTTKEDLSMLLSVSHSFSDLVFPLDQKTVMSKLCLVVCTFNLSTQEAKASRSLSLVYTETYRTDKPNSKSNKAETQEPLSCSKVQIEAWMLPICYTQAY